MVGRKPSLFIAKTPGRVVRFVGLEDRESTTVVYLICDERNSQPLMIEVHLTLERPVRLECRQIWIVIVFIVAPHAQVSNGAFAAPLWIGCMCPAILLIGGWESLNEGVFGPVPFDPLSPLELFNMDDD